MAKNNRLRGEVDKPASPAAVRQRSRDQLYTEGRGDSQYLTPGKGNEFDEALADFATAYAEQNERGYKALVRAVRQGRIEVYTES
jgi:Uncharacterized protein conserved in bacteria (DUF2252)